MRISYFFGFYQRRTAPSINPIKKQRVLRNNQASEKKTVTKVKIM